MKLIKDDLMNSKMKYNSVGEGFFLWGFPKLLILKDVKYSRLLYKHRGMDIVFAISWIIIWLQNEIHPFNPPI